MTFNLFSPTSPERTVRTADGSLTMAHPEHGECYHSRAGARREANALYVESSGFRERLASGQGPVHVLDVGLGLGYNAVATMVAWLEAGAPCNLQITSLEVDPDLVSRLVSGQAPWQLDWPAAELELVTRPARISDNTWSAGWVHPQSGCQLSWDILVGDAAGIAFDDMGPWNFVWQDPFSPALNPPLWSAEWFARLRPGAASDCILMTYSVARAVRDALSAGGWSWDKIPTPVREKRHWLRARPGSHVLTT